MQDKKDLKDQHPAAGSGLEGALGPCVKVGKENRGRQRLVRSDALIQREDKREKKVSGEAKVMEGKVGPCCSRHLDDWIGRVGVGLRGCRCVGVEGSRGCREGREGRRCGGRWEGFW